MPIQAEPDGTLDVENATLRSRNIVSLTNMVAGNDVVRSTAAPTLEVYGDPSHGGTEPTLELVSNTSNTVSTTFTRLTSNAGVFTIQSGTAGTADSKGDIAFSSIGGSTEHMRIQGSTGNVGIGTDAPGNSLHVYKAAAEGTSGLFIEKASGDAGTTAALFFGVNTPGENPGVAKAAIFYERNLVNGRGDLKFCNDAVDDANSVSTEASDTRMLIQNNGRVAINNTTAHSWLDVNGSIHCNGSFSITGSSYLAYNMKQVSRGGGDQNFVFYLNSACAHYPGIVKINVHTINANSGAPDGWHWIYGFDALNCGSHVGGGVNETLSGGNPGSGSFAANMNSGTGAYTITCKPNGRNYIIAECEVSYYGGIFL